MRKPSQGHPIKTLTDAREADQRNHRKLVYGMRLGYALWPVEEEECRKVCKELGVAYSPTSVVRGGVVKANGPSSRMIATYVRDKTGLLIDCSCFVATISAKTVRPDDTTAPCDCRRCRGRPAIY